MNTQKSGNALFGTHIAALYVKHPVCFECHINVTIEGDS